MACYKPLEAYKKLGGGITFNRDESAGIPQTLPCNRCIGCRLHRSRTWAIRCMHETQMHQDNCFITLTYNNKNLPTDGQLLKRDFQLFMKRLRKNTGQKIRFYHCGEYGSKLSRPHFHAILFGYNPPDLRLHTENNGEKLYTSEQISQAWQYQGFALIGTATFESAAYISRYIMKKVNGEQQYEHYANSDGVLLNPEYTTMSRKPGIGSDWYEKYKTDVFPSDQVILKGKPLPPPSYYLNKYELSDPAEFLQLKRNRKEAQKLQKHNTTPERLKARETVKQSQLTQLKRTYEHHD